MAPNPDILRIRWSKPAGALLYVGSKPTGGMLATVFEKTEMEMHYVTLVNPNRYLSACHAGDPFKTRTLAQEIDARGYDLKTLRFQIKKKVT